MLAVCDNCGKEFNRKTSQLLKYKNCFCSRECLRIGMLGKSSDGQFKIAYDHIDSNGLLLCTSCGEYKDQSLFSKRKNIPHRYDRGYFCLECAAKSHHRLYKNRRPSKVKYLNTIDGFIKSIVQHAKNRKKSKEYGYDLDFNYIMDMYNNQDGLCAISNVRMTTISGSGIINTNLSIDRIDSSIGYLKGNIQLVCRIVNLMKSDMSSKEFYLWCNMISKNNSNE